MAVFWERNRSAVVIGAALLVGVFMAASPASAQLHRSDIGTGLAAGAASVAAAGTATAGGYGGCAWQRQKIWDGYSWRYQRLQVCD